MIQRIQTLYLLIAAALVAATVFTPLAYFACGNGEFALNAFALTDDAGETVQSTVYMGVLLALSGILPFVTIFLYGKRLVQIRLCVVEMVLLVGSMVMMGIYYYLSVRAFSQGEFLAKSVNIGMFLPSAALIAVILAVRAIFRDEMLVRSADRIR